MLNIKTIAVALSLIIGSVQYSAGATTRGLVPQLAAKVAQIQAACGSRLMSGFAKRKGNPRSLHNTGRGADMSGNPGCIYANLRNWSGGYTTDYYRVKPNHVHISYGGSEHGLRFTHRRTGKATRYAGQYDSGNYTVAYNTHAPQ